ncbi:hypothetical protein Tco_0628517 [Tanacetum coccineum]|uniref:Uncharacterized protein n=1 Tax=Tanacetum coccineum TaxID=301880 RepID=A0ABQ4WQI1_9ASTR
MKKENMSIEEMRREQLMVDDEIKDISNYLSYKRFRGEKIDDEYERDCEIKIEQLLQDYNGLGIEIRKKERILMEEKSLAVTRRIQSICDDDDEYSIQTQEYLKKFSSTINPVLPIEEPDNSLSMGDEYLDTILSVENLVPLPSKFEGISDDTCDVSVSEDPSTFDALSDHSEILSDSNDDGTSSDDDDFEDIEYVNVILREKLLNVYRLVTNIESLKNNPTPDYVLESPSIFPIPVVDSDSFFEESDTSLSHLDNSLPEFKTFYGHTEETRSGSTTTHANYSLPEYDSFLFEIEPDQEGLISIDNSNSRLNDDQRGSEIDFSQNVEDGDSFTFVIRTFLPFLNYPADSLLLLSIGNEHFATFQVTFALYGLLDDKPELDGLIGLYQLIYDKLELVDLSSFEQTPLSAISYLLSVCLDGIKELAEKPAKKLAARRHSAGVQIKDTPGVSMSNKKAQAKAKRSKGIQLLSEAALLEEAQLKKAIKRSKRETNIHQVGGLSEGAGLKSEVPDEPKGKSIHTSKGTGLKPGVHDVSKVDSFKSDDERTQSNNEKAVDLNKTDDEEEYEFVHTPKNYVPTNDETNDVDDEEYDHINKEMYDDVNVELRDAEPVDEGKDDKEMTDAGHVDVEHKNVNQEVRGDQVKDVDQATVTVALLYRRLNLVTSIPPPILPFIPLPQQSTPPTPTTTEATISTTTTPDSKTFFAIHQSLSDLENDVKTLRNGDQSLTIHTTIKSEVPTIVKECLGTNLDDTLEKSILEDEDAMDKGVVDKLNKRKPDDANRDEGPPARSNQGLKRKKTSKDVEPSKKAKSIETSKGTKQSQPKSTGKSA